MCVCVQAHVLTYAHIDILKYQWYQWYQRYLWNKQISKICFTPRFRTSGRSPAAFKRRRKSSRSLPRAAADWSDGMKQLSDGTWLMRFHVCQTAYSSCRIKMCACFLGQKSMAPTAASVLTVSTGSSLLTLLCLRCLKLPGVVLEVCQDDSANLLFSTPMVEQLPPRISQWGGMKDNWT